MSGTFRESGRDTGEESPDVLGDLGNDSVAEGGDAGRLQSVGNPINHSTASAGGLHEPVDWIRPRTRVSVSGRYRPPCPRPQPRLPMDAVGVGHEEHPVSCVWGTHGACGKHSPPRIEPERGQASEDPSEGFGVVEKSPDVFHDDVVGS
jgi:hypothetical protein